MPNYEILNGRIVSPGKFEGEEGFVPYFWEQAGDGTGEDLNFPGESYVAIEIDAEDSAKFPQLAHLHGHYVVMLERDDGFVISTIVTPKRLMSLQEDAEKAWEGMSQD